MRSEPPNKQLERTKGAVLVDAAPFAAQLRRSPDNGSNEGGDRQHEDAASWPAPIGCVRTRQWPGRWCPSLWVILVRTEPLQRRNWERAWSQQ